MVGVDAGHRGAVTGRVAEHGDVMQLGFDRQADPGRAEQRRGPYARRPARTVPGGSGPAPGSARRSTRRFARCRRGDGGVRPVPHARAPGPRPAGRRPPSRRPRSHPRAPTPPGSGRRCAGRGPAGPSAAASMTSASAPRQRCMATLAARAVLFAGRTMRAKPVRRTHWRAAGQLRARRRTCASLRTASSTSGAERVVHPDQRRGPAAHPGPGRVPVQHQHVPGAQAAEMEGDRGTDDPGPDDDACRVPVASAWLRQGPLTWRPGPFQVGQHPVGRVVAGGTGDPAARMRARAAQVQPAHRGGVPRPARHRPHVEQLVRLDVAVEDVALGEPVGPLQVERGEHLAGDHGTGHVRRERPIRASTRSPSSSRRLVPAALALAGTARTARSRS